MAIYKGIHFSDHVAPVVRYMSSLNDHRETLAILSGTWDTLSLLGHLSNLKTDMGGVRQGFANLTGELLSCLADETMAHEVSVLNFQAQIAVDVLTRNLYERTADIGFLATDLAIVSACASADTAALEGLRQRFLSYTSKYTVYKDIILMRPDGQVLVRMNDGFSGCSTSDILQKARSTRDGYVETYAATDFCGGDVALTYAYRVESHGSTVGVLVLEFDIRAEVRTILAHLRERNEIVAFLNAQGQILLSSDRVLLPAGILLPIRKGAATLRLGGIQYIFSQRFPTPYQGYAGPGWSAVALSVAEMAFDDCGTASSRVNFTGENVFSQRLLAIPEQARQIQHRLDRLVWNGRVQQSDDSNAFSRSLLEEIALTGRKTKEVFERSSAELLTMVASSLLNEAQFLAGLAVDILDRNLYERANDCRWWAASPALATLDAQTCRETLVHINGLYTVYANLFVFDAQGRVIAASRDTAIEGQLLSAAWVDRCLNIREPMGYAVSPFERSGLYADERTYIFSAPIIDNGRVVGGVGLVFDSTSQFLAMLEAALPKAAGALALFCRPDGSAISQTGALPMPLPAAVLNLAPGQHWSGVVTQGERCFSVGATAGSGYREFKTTDAYVEPIIGIIVVPCGTLSSNGHKTANTMVAMPGGTEIASFYIGEQLMGVVAKDVIECIDVPRAIGLTGAAMAKRHVGYTTWGNKALPLLDLNASTREIGQGNGQRHALVLHHDDADFGLLVTGLGPVIEMQVFGTQRLAEQASGSHLFSTIARSGEVLVPILSAQELLAVARQS